MKRLIYSIIGTLCYPAVMIVKHFVKDEVNLAAIAGIIVGICTTCIIISFITED